MAKKGQSGRIVMSTYDRIQALIRNETYLQDLAKVQEQFNLAEREAFFRKYKLNGIIIDKEFAFQYDAQQLEEAAIFTDEPAVEIIPHKPTKIEKGALTVAGEPGEMELIIRDIKPWLKEGHFLTVRIDVTKPHKDIHNKIQTYIDLFKIQVEREAGRLRDNRLSPWDVYVMHHEENMTFADIAKDISGINCSIYSDPNLEAKYKEVRRAYKKATRMIKQIVKKDF